MIVLLAGCMGVQVPDTGERRETADTSEEPPSREAVLRNFTTPCASVRAVFPASGEEGHRHAARLVPPAWPFRIDRVRVPLVNGVGDEVSCYAGYTHVVEVFTSGALPPPASPELVAEWTFPPIAVAGDARLLEAAVDGLVLEDGEDLFVAVRTTGLYPEVTCVAACEDATAPDGDWWSGASEAPYDWARLADLGVGGNAMISADGEAL